jgi:hypothetical protein
MEKETIKERLLGTGDNLILLFATKESGGVSGERPPAGRAFFFKVLAATELQRKYTDIMTAETADYLDTETGVDWGYLGDTGIGSGDDVLRIEDDDWWIYHFGYAPLQWSLRVYKRLDVGDPQTGWEYSLSDEPDPTNGDRYGFIAGREVIDYWDPPKDTETVAFRSREEGRMWNWGFYNESDERQINPILNIIGAAYKTIPIVKSTIQDKLITGEIPRRLITVDGIKNFNEETIIPKAWKAVGNEREVTFEQITGVFTRGKRVVRVPMMEETASRLGAFIAPGEDANQAIDRLLNQARRTS